MKKFVFSLIGVLLFFSCAYGESLDIHYQRLETLFKQGDYNQALSECKKIVELAPDDVHGYENLGYCYYKTKKYDHAIENFEKAIDLKTDYSYSWYYIALSLFHKKHYDQSIAKFKEFIRRFPSDEYVPSAVHSIAVAYFCDKKYSLAIDMYNKVIKDYPDYRKIEYVKFSLANVYFRDKKYKSTIAVLEEFLGIYSKSKFSTRAYSLLAAAYSKEGMPEKSIATLQKGGILYITLVVIIGIFLLIMVPFVIGVYLFGKFLKKRRTTETAKTSPNIFRIRDVILATLATILLPFMIAPVIGKLLYGHYAIGFMATTKSLESLYTMCISMIVTGAILAFIVLWLIFRKYLLNKKDVGFIFSSVKSITILPIITLLILEILYITYEYIVTKILNLTLPEQFLTIIVSSIKTLGQGLTLFLAIVVIIPIVEEIIFRVFFYNAFKKYTNIKWGIVFSSLFFAIYHFEPACLLPLFFIGVALAYVYERTKSIVPCVVIHGLNNFICFVSAYFFNGSKI